MNQAKDNPVGQSANKITSNTNFDKIIGDQIVANMAEQLRRVQANEGKGHMQVADEIYERQVRQFPELYEFYSVYRKSDPTSDENQGQVGGFTALEKKELKDKIKDVVLRAQVEQERMDDWHSKSYFKYTNVENQKLIASKKQLNQTKMAGKIELNINKTLTSQQKILAYACEEQVFHLHQKRFLTQHMKKLVPTPPDTPMTKYRKQLLEEALQLGNKKKTVQESPVKNDNSPNVNRRMSLIGQELIKKTTLKSSLPQLDSKKAGSWRQGDQHPRQYQSIDAMERRSRRNSLDEYLEPKSPSKVNFKDSTAQSTFNNKLGGQHHNNTGRATQQHFDHGEVNLHLHLVKDQSVQQFHQQVNDDIKYISPNPPNINIISDLQKNESEPQEARQRYSSIDQAQELSESEFSSSQDALQMSNGMIRMAVMSTRKTLNAEEEEEIKKRKKRVYNYNFSGNTSMTYLPGLKHDTLGSLSKSNLHSFETLLKKKNQHAQNILLAKSNFNKKAAKKSYSQSMHKKSTFSDKFTQNAESIKPLPLVKQNMSYTLIKELQNKSKVGGTLSSVKGSSLNVQQKQIPLKKKLRLDCFKIAQDCDDLTAKIDTEKKKAFEELERFKFYDRQYKFTTNLLEQFDEMEPKFVSVVFENRASDANNYFEDIQNLKKERKQSKTAV